MRESPHAFLTCTIASGGNGGQYLVGDTPGTLGATSHVLQDDGEEHRLVLGELELDLRFLTHLRIASFQTPLAWRVPTRAW